MSELHKKMYAGLVGDVDEVIEFIGNRVLVNSCGKEELIAVGERLKEALLRAEETYLSAEE